VVPAATGLPEFTSTSGRLTAAPKWPGCTAARISGGRRGQRLLSSSASPAVSSLSSNEDLLPGISAIQSANSDLHRMLEVVREQPYFRLYSVDILASCEYLPQELFECYTESCEIYPAEEGEVRALLAGDAKVGFPYVCSLLT
jgi:Endoplasmic Reticulum Oxidoreductin 1 (ERO1)